MQSSLNKLKSIARFLKLSDRFHFQNFNLALFLNFLKSDPEIALIINSLLINYPEFKKDLIDRKLAETDSDSIGIYRSILVDHEKDNFESWVAFCISYIEAVGTNKGNKVIDNFIIETYNKEDNENLSPKMRFYNNCIEPILIFIELQIKHSLNTLRIFERYKILCEWYDKEDLLKLKELKITKNHLSKFLFEQGFTYCLSETNVPSGRIDNFAIRLHLKKRELMNIPDIIVAEGKIFNKSKRDIIDVKNQVQKRIEELNLTKGYCVVFNKTKNEIRISNAEGNINGFYYINLGKKKIYFIIINLNEVFYKSKSTIKKVFIEVK